jgi:hypothetical protein
MFMDLDERDSWINRVQQEYLKDPYFKDIILRLEHSMNLKCSAQEV